MNKNECICNTVGIVVVILLILGTGVSTYSSYSVYAQPTATLGEPFLVEQGQITGQKEIGPDRTQFTYSSNGTLNGNIEITGTGNFVSVSKDDNQAFDQGQGVISIKDTGETANYTFIEVDNATEEGKLVFLGAAVYNTNSTGELSFLNNVLEIFKGEQDVESGNFVSTSWIVK